MAFWQLFSTGLIACSSSLVKAGSMIVKINFSKKSLVIASLGQSIVSFLIQDDLISVSQGIKAFMPVFAALPLMAIKEGQYLMKIPLNGIVNFGVYYSLILVPLGITGVANAVNMLAGFNGLEVGMRVVAVGSLAIIAYLVGEITALIILIAALGALLATIYYKG